MDVASNFLKKPINLLLSYGSRVGWLLIAAGNSRNDLLGAVYNGTTLKSIGANPGGYISYIAPQTMKTHSFSITTMTQRLRTE